jgi:hypothetical protein
MSSGSVPPLPQPARPHNPTARDATAGYAQFGSGCIATGQTLLGACEAERGIISPFVPLSVEEAPQAQDVMAALQALEDGQPPSAECCEAVDMFEGSDCAEDATLLSVLPSVGITPIGLNATLGILEQVCF